MRARVLLSGGIDSAACLVFYRDRGFDVDARFVDYGQLAATQEARAAAQIAAALRVPLSTFTWSGGQAKGAGEILGRNAFLLCAALLELGEAQGILALGVHSGTDYWDCSPGFLRAAQAILDGYASGRVRVAAPFLDWTKDQVFGYARGRVPIELTWSCELGGAAPCGTCRSCRDVEALRAG